MKIYVTNFLCCQDLIIQGHCMIKVKTKVFSSKDRFDYFILEMNFIDITLIQTYIHKFSFVFIQFQEIFRHPTANLIKQLVRFERSKFAEWTSNAKYIWVSSAYKCTGSSTFKGEGKIEQLELF